MSGQYESQPTRRRKRKPKWQRMLHKYWPTIRFGLICLTGLLLIIGIICLIAGPKEPDPDKNAAGNNTSASPENALAVPLTANSSGEQQAKLIWTQNKAEQMAAGYDYQGAIELLKAHEHYGENQELQTLAAQYAQLDAQLISYPDIANVTHVFFHSLIVDTARAFDGDYTEGGYNQYMTTIDEFVSMMESMYQRGYVLVSPYDVAYEVTDDTGSHFVYGDIRLPEGKIPFIMSQDDLNYYGYMIGAPDDPDYVNPAQPSASGDGFAFKLVVGEDGYPTCLYMDENGNVTAGDYDLVPVLEKFIQEHPDFSYHGARAVLGVTGYEGVFGYRTKPVYEETLGTEAYQKELEDARAVADCLRSHGWILASHSYGHPSYGSLSTEGVERDSDRWEETVQPVIGDCDVILYPNGSDIAGLEKYSFDNGKFAALYEDGYRYFFNVDSSIYWCQLGENYYRGGRRNLDGYRMYYNPDMLSDLFDVDEVWDPARTTPVPPI